MAKIHSPRHGSMQFWPRVKAKSTVARVRSWSTTSKDPLLGFIGYKAGMTHLMGINTDKNSTSKGEEIVYPVTIIECPPMKVAGIRVYKKKYGGEQPSKDILFKLGRDVSRKIVVPKKPQEISELSTLKADEYSDLTLLVYTQPRMAGIGKKRPEFVEMGLSGTVAEKIEFTKNHYDKDLMINTFFKDGEYVDIHAVTKGKGLHGPVRRFGVAFKPHKTEKGVRRVGTLGAWSGQGHVLYRVPHPGQMGYHMRTEYNKQIFKISNKPEEVNPKGAFPHYGLVKSWFIVIKGSVAGSQKRAILFTKAIRHKVNNTMPTITFIRK